MADVLNNGMLPREAHMKKSLSKEEELQIEVIRYSAMAQVKHVHTINVDIKDKLVILRDTYLFFR